VHDTIDDDHAGNAEHTAGPARILIVEDEVLVRMFAADALDEAGFKVEEAETGAQALASLTRLRDVISAVIIDLGLPDRTGDQVAADMRAIRPDLPILIASGRSEKELRERFALDGKVSIIVKPFTGPMLIHALETLGIVGTPQQ
jgi:DNA-binding response OmpR family regulator